MGAGDQGLMFGYATDETEELMPLTVVLAHGLNRKLAECRRNGTMAWLRPDSKTQVTVEYRFENGAAIPLRVHTIVISTQHDPDITLQEQKKQLQEKIIKVSEMPQQFATAVWSPRFGVSSCCTKWRIQGSFDSGSSRLLDIKT